MSESSGLVYIVDDDASVRRSLTRLVQSTGYDVESYGCARDFIAHVHASCTPACVVLDVRLPDASGLEVQSKIDPRLPIIFLTGHGDIAMTVRALKAGATDFLTKPVLEECLIPAIQQALARSAELARKLGELDDLRRRALNLTSREREVMDLVVMGRLNKQVADELGTTEKTVKAQRGKVMCKMKVRSVADLVRAADKIAATYEQGAQHAALGAGAIAEPKSPTRATSSAWRVADTATGN
jgi:FixJ family two-component response regulator